MRPRSRALTFDHLPSNALRAAVTARSMSSLSASATSASVSPVAGFGVVNVLPDAASTHCPSIRSWYLRVVFSSTGCTDDIMTPSNHSLSLCNLRVLCVSVVNLESEPFTTETQSTQRTHREIKNPSCPQESV